MTFRFWAGFSQQGTRKRQEDFIIPSNGKGPSPHCFAVCDGVGGSPCGHIASKVVGEAIEGFFGARQSLLLDEWPQLESAIVQTLRETAFHQPECEGLASTLAGVVELAGEVWAFWCGDSRVYHLRSGEILWQTTDHNIKEEFAQKGMPVPQGLMGGVITHVASENPRYLKIAKKRLEMRSGDRIFICTDGVHGYVPQERWLAALAPGFSCSEAVTSIQGMCEELSRDNYSGWVVE